MTKRHNAKYKIDRRLGVNLWGRPKSPFNRRNSKPGQHGVQGQRKKLSDYGNQLFAKQKLKFYYGDLTERQFRNIFKKASNIKGDTSQILIELLERRLDATVYRAPLLILLNIDPDFGTLDIAPQTLPFIIKTLLSPNLILFKNF